VSVFVRPCAKCAAKKAGDRRNRRGRKGCRDCRWRAVTPPKLDRKTLGVFDTREEAEAKVQEALVNHRRGIDLLPTDLTVSELVERYFKDGTTDLSVTTRHRYRELWSIHGSKLGKHSIADLRKAHIANLYATLQREPRGKRKPLNPRTILHLHRVLHRAFEWAVEVDLIGANIFRRIRSPKVKDVDTRALSLEEAGSFFDGARGSTFEAFFHVAALTGARRGELVGLKWDAVDLDSGALTVRTSLASTRAKKAERAAGLPPSSSKARSRESPDRFRSIATRLLFSGASRPPKRPTSLRPSRGNTSTKASSFRISTGVRSSSTRPRRPFERSPTWPSCLLKSRYTRCVIRSRHGQSRAAAILSRCKGALGTPYRARR